MFSFCKRSVKNKKTIALGLSPSSIVCKLKLYSFMLRPTSVFGLFDRQSRPIRLLPLRISIRRIQPDRLATRTKRPDRCRTSFQPKSRWPARSKRLFSSGASPSLESGLPDGTFSSNLSYQRSSSVFLDRSPFNSFINILISLN